MTILSEAAKVGCVHVSRRVLPVLPWLGTCDAQMQSQGAQRHRGGSLCLTCLSPSLFPSLSLTLSPSLSFLCPPSPSPSPPLSPELPGPQLPLRPEPPRGPLQGEPAWQEAGGCLYVTMHALICGCHSSRACVGEPSASAARAVGGGKPPSCPARCL